MRGGALGHHQALEKEERFSRFRSEEFARPVWALGAMAAERVFYGENSNGVGGDVQSVTAQAAYMVGASAMGPQPFELEPREGETEEEARERVLERFQKIGVQILNRTSGGGPFAENPVASVLGDPDKRAIASQLVGQAYVAAHNLILANREAVEKIADVLAARRELFGDELSSCSRERSSRSPTSTSPKRARGRERDPTLGGGGADPALVDAAAPPPGVARGPRAPARLPRALHRALPPPRDHGRSRDRRPRRPRPAGQPCPGADLVGVAAGRER
jgi:hypothetical protein